MTGGEIMSYKDEAELAVQIVIAAIQSGKISAESAEYVASYYATIFNQIIASSKEQSQIDDSLRSSFENSCI